MSWTSLYFEVIWKRRFYGVVIYADPVEDIEFGLFLINNYSFPYTETGLLALGVDFAWHVCNRSFGSFRAQTAGLLFYYSVIFGIDFLAIGDKNSMEIQTVGNIWVLGMPLTASVNRAVIVMLQLDW